MQAPDILANKDKVNGRHEVISHTPFIKNSDENKAFENNIPGIIEDINNLILNNQYQEALTTIKLVNALTNDIKIKEHLILQKGYIYYRQGNKEKCYKFYKKHDIKHSNTKFVELIDNYGNILDEKNDYDEAIKMYDKAIILDEKFYPAHNNKAVALWHKGKKYYDDAIKELHIALRYNSNCKQAYLNLGNIYVSKKDFKQALENYKKALAIDPNYWQASECIAKVLLYLRVCSHPLTNEIIFSNDEIIQYFKNPWSAKFNDSYQHEPLESLKLDNNRITHLIRYIKFSYSKGEIIDSIDLSNSKITSEVIKKLIDEIALSSLDLSNCQLNDTNLSEIAKSCNITRLHIANNKITNSGIIKLIECKSLLEVNIDFNHIDTKTINLLLEAIERNKRNADIYLKACRDSEIILVEQILKETQVSPYVKDPITGFTSLESALNNKNWQLANTIIRSILQNYEPHQSIFEFCMSILYHYPYGGTTFDLSNCKLNLTHIPQLSKYLSKQNSIQSINLSNNYIEYNEAEILIKNALKNDSIQIINLSNNLINTTQQKLDSINDAINEANRRINIDISNNYIKCSSTSIEDKHIKISKNKFFTKEFNNENRNNSYKRYGFFHSYKKENSSNSILAKNEIIPVDRDNWVIALAHKNSSTHAMLLIEGVNAEGQKFFWMFHLQSSSLAGYTASLSIKEYDPKTFINQYNSYKLNYKPAKKDQIKTFLNHISAINHEELFYSIIPAAKGSVNCVKLILNNLKEVGIEINDPMLPQSPRIKF